MAHRQGPCNSANTNNNSINMIKIRVLPKYHVPYASFHPSPIARCTSTSQAGVIKNALWTSQKATKIFTTNNLKFSVGTMKYFVTSEKTQASWKEQLSALIKKGLYERASSLIDNILEKPQLLDSDLLALIASYYSTQKDCVKMKKLIQMINQHHLTPTTEIYNLALNCYASAVEIDLMKNLFEEMSHQQIPADSSTYNALILGFAKKGDVDTMLNFFHWMKEEQIPRTEVTYSFIATGLAVQGNLDLLLEYFQEMKKDNVKPSSRMYEPILWHLVKKNHTKLFELFTRMKQEGIHPSTNAYNAKLTALGLLGRKEDMKFNLEEMRSNGLVFNEVTHKLIERYLITKKYSTQQQPQHNQL